MIGGRFDTVRVTIAILGLAIGAVAQAQGNDMEIPVIDPGPEIGRWQMFSPAGEGIMSSLPFLYDTATGRVWRLFTECGDDPEDANGCLVELPAYPSTVDIGSVIEAMTQAIQEAVQDADDSGNEGN